MAMCASAARRANSFISTKSTRSAGRMRTRPSPATSRAKCAAAAAEDPSKATVANVPPQGGQKASAPGIHADRYHQYSVICGGAFVGSKKIIARRTGKKSMGFLQEEAGQREQTKTVGISERRDVDLLRHLQPQDLIRYGFYTGVSLADYRWWLPSKTWTRRRWFRFFPSPRTPLSSNTSGSRI